MTTLRTWSGSSQFKYEGTVEKGTDIWPGQAKYPINVSGADYGKLLSNFKRREVAVGPHRVNPPADSLGEWLQANVSQTAIASYVAPILVKEQHAVRVKDTTKLKFK